MVKNENSGIVSVKFLNKSYLLASFLFFGCASSAYDSVQAEADWKARYELCQNQGVENKIAFPDSIWFDSLSIDDKKTVIGYFANYSDRQCMSEASTKLKNILVREGNQAKLDYYEIDFTPLEQLARERTQHLNKTQLKNLEQEFKAPFNLRYMLVQEDLFPRN